MKNQYAKKKDSTHNEIKAALIEVGWQVTDIYFCGRGIPDLICASACLPAPITILAEAKTPGEKLSPAEVRFHKMFVGNVMIVDSGTCAVALASEIRARHLGITL